MPSVGPTPEDNFFIYAEDDTDQFAVHWRGTEWGTDHHADRRFWYHDELSEAGYEYLLRHYGLVQHRSEFTYEVVRRTSPEVLLAESRKLRDG
jgi:hypothetical protein